MLGPPRDGRLLVTHMVPRENDGYDVIIIGAGVTGTALFHLLAKYTDVRRVLLLEKYASVAEVSSHADHNSQTLHFGDIETNYTVEKAKAVKSAAEMIVRYAEREGGDGILRGMQKMVLGVGHKEVAALAARCEEFKDLFPECRLIGREELAQLEPAVVDGRDPGEPVAAIHNERGFAVDFGKLAESFVASSRRHRQDGFDVRFGVGVKRVRRESGKFTVTTDAGAFSSDAVVVAAGAHSLKMAHDMGLGRDLTLLPVAGDFFTAPNVLRGKVYTVQERKLPFAAVHADPDVADHGTMRLGPIALAVPLLEPGRWHSVWSFFRVFRPTLDTAATVYKVNADPIVARFVSRHVLYYLPFIGRWLFARDARKIVPSLRLSDVRRRPGLGGIRPQVADIKRRSLMLGEAKIVDDGIIFNITPSPGASVCLKNAEEDVRRLMAHFAGKFRFNEEQFAQELA